jgi:hypothetical protein
MAAQADSADLDDPPGRRVQRELQRGPPQPGPDADRGLVFIAYMADIDFQFEFLQRQWVNNTDFLQTGTGRDPVIGQDTDVNLKLENLPDGKKLHFAQFVRTEGTTYAFAPALSTLRSLAQRP